MKFSVSAINLEGQIQTTKTSATLFLRFSFYIVTKIYSKLTYPALTTVMFWERKIYVCLKTKEIDLFLSMPLCLH